MAKVDSKILSIIEWFSIIAAIIILVLSWTKKTIAPGLSVLCTYLLIQWFIIIVSCIIAGILLSLKSKENS